MSDRQLPGAFSPTSQTDSIGYPPWDPGPAAPPGHDAPSAPAYGSDHASYASYGAYDGGHAGYDGYAGYDAYGGHPQGPSYDGNAGYGGEAYGGGTYGGVPYGSDYGPYGYGTGTHGDGTSYEPQQDRPSPEAYAAYAGRGHEGYESHHGHDGYGGEHPPSGGTTGEAAENWSAPAAAPVPPPDQWPTMAAPVVPQQPGPPAWEPAAPQGPGPEPWDGGFAEGQSAEGSGGDGPVPGGPGGSAIPQDPGPLLHDAGYDTSDGTRPAGRHGGTDVYAEHLQHTARGRRRQSRPRRSALLSVAAPSLAFLGVTAVATAAVSTSESAEEEAPVAASAPDSSVAKARTAAANQQFDTQLESLTAAVDDYADRASRTQGRIDLRKQREAEERAAAAEAARLEALRPKFWLPVEQAGLSAYYGQSGINWMSLHTGIDFPVSYGTPVMAASDGTVRTQWHISYGNMLILTAPDGTETWYAHLDSTVYQSGYVQAGTVIAYSGNSGNSTGPHLHFEVRPGGGSAIDPLVWLRGKGLEPT